MLHLVCACCRRVLHDAEQVDKQLRGQVTSMDIKDVEAADDEAA